MANFKAGDITLTTNNYYIKILNVDEEKGYVTSPRRASLVDPDLDTIEMSNQYKDIEIFDQSHRLYSADLLMALSLEDAIKVISAYYNLNPNSITIVTPGDPEGKWSLI